MDIQNYKDNTQVWRSIVAIIMVISGCACFVISSICAMLVAKKQK